MTQYVLGLAFDQAASRIALILKNHPAWQTGKYNGIGGQIEEAEWYRGAMIREFREETGVDTHPVLDWMLLGNLKGQDYQVVLFAMFNNKTYHVQTTTDESVAIFDVDKLPPNIDPDLKWLVPAAILRQQRPFDVLAVY